jgi:hypothetical protein
MDLPLFIASFFVFIMSLIGALGHFFGRHWKWFFIILACVVISGACTFIELYLWLAPPPPHELPVIVRQPLTPL